jgi:two-component system response regulator BaeR
MYPSTTPRQACIIEDEFQLAAIYAKALDMAGYQTKSIQNGQEAIDYLRTLPVAPSLIVLDLNLPMFPGKDILRFIRMDARYIRTRVILATSDSAAVVGEIEDKSDIVLLKPISFTQLRDLASRFL